MLKINTPQAARFLAFAASYALRLRCYSLSAMCQLAFATSNKPLAVRRVPRATCQEPNDTSRLPRATCVFIFAASALMVLCVAPSVRAQQPARLALLPFENLSGNVNSRPVVMPLIEQGMKTKGYQITSPEKLEPFLLQRRIRNTGILSGRQLKDLKQTFGVEFAMVGSIHLFHESEENPQWGLSARILSTAAATILWAQSTGLTGDDFTRMLGLGTIKSASKLAEEVVKALLQSLPFSDGPFPAARAQQRFSTRPFGSTIGYRSPTLDAPSHWRVAVLPFENRSERRGAGRIITDVFTTALFRQRRLEIIDPGEVNEALTSLVATPFGAIDVVTLRGLRNRTGIDAIFLGTVYHYNEGLKREGGGSPEVAMDVSMIHTDSGKILWFASTERSGEDYRTLLDFGIIRSMVPLILQAVGEILRTL